MKKNKLWLLNLAAVLVIAGLVFTGCPTDGGDDTGGIDAGQVGVFDINNLPEPSYWNNRPTMTNFPSLFQFADGTKVTTADQWPKRREEISKIMQHYMYGYLPPQGTSDIEVTFADEGTPADAIPGALLYTNITVKNLKNNQSASFRVGIRLPTTGTAPYPMFIRLAGSDTPDTTTGGDGANPSGNNVYIWEKLNAAGWGIMSYNVSLIGRESNEGTAVTTGVVNDIFNYAPGATDANAPGVIIKWAWGVGRIMDAIEKGAFYGKVDVNKLAVQGNSRWGKGTLSIGAWAQSQSGKQIAMSFPTGSGSGGASLERFMSPIQILPGATNVEGAPGKTLYIKYTNDGTVDAPADGSMKVVLPTEAHDATFNAWVDNPDTPDVNENYWGGLQTISEARWEMYNWFNGRLQLFQDHYPNLNVDKVDDQPDRQTFGYLDSIPWDMHFPMSLIAPRGLMVFEGVGVFRNNPEAEFLNFLMTDEVYKFLGAETKHGHRQYNHNHAIPWYTTNDFIAFGQAIFNGTTPPAKYRPMDLYPIKDERSKVDYQKVNWARPGGTSIADQIK